MRTFPRVWTPTRLIKLIIMLVVLLAFAMYFSSCTKATQPYGKPLQTIEVRVQGVNADNTSAGYSEIAVFRG